MKKTITIFLLLLFTFGACAQHKIRFSLDTQYLFDNHEFNASGGEIIPSETFHFVRFTPGICWEFSGSEDWSHSLNLGLDLIKDAGSTVPFGQILHEAPLYINSCFNQGDTQFTAIFGVYPRRLVEGWYSELILSEETAQSDFNLEGTLLKYSEGSVSAELGMDWMGKYATTAKSVSRFSAPDAGD